MKHNFFNKAGTKFLLFLFCVTNPSANVFALGPGDLDGRITPIVVDQAYTFSDGNFARGFVSFQQGFTVPAGARVRMGVTEVINGPLYLNNTGKLILESPLILGLATDNFENNIIFPDAGGTEGAIYFTQGLAWFNFHQYLTFHQNMILDFNGKSLIFNDISGRGGFFMDSSVGRRMKVQNANIFEMATGPDYADFRFAPTSTTTNEHTLFFDNVDCHINDQGFSLENANMEVDHDVSFGTKSIVGSILLSSITQLSLFYSSLKLTGALRLWSTANVTFKDNITLILQPATTLGADEIINNFYLSNTFGRKITFDDCRLVSFQPLTFANCRFVFKNNVDFFTASDVSADQLFVIDDFGNILRRSIFDIAPAANLIINRPLTLEVRALN
jgi:hypothetical protein